MKTLEKKVKDYNVLTWVFFASQGIVDNVNLMRCQLLCMEVIKDGANLESVKESTGYKSCIYDIPDHLISDQKIIEMLNFSI
jgi:hypothetical protein